jgi:hypothetical protein
MCVGYNKCSCFSGYSNLNCSDYKCFGFSSVFNGVCSGNGKCISSDMCQCISTFYKGQNCDDVSNIVGIVLGLLLPILILVLLVCIISILIIIFIIFALILLKIYQKNKTLLNIQNQGKIISINLELQEKLLLLNNMNKISFKKIKFDKKNNENVILGKGATSIVYSGTIGNQKVAIKQITSNQSNDSLISEIVLSKNLSQENIVKFFGYCINENSFFIITGNININFRINVFWCSG